MLLATLAQQAVPHILMVVIAGSGTNTPTVGSYPDAAAPKQHSDAYVWCLPDPVPGRRVLEGRP